MMKMIFRHLVMVVALLLASTAAPGAEKEDDVQRQLCPSLADVETIEINKHLPDGSEADCVTSEYAVEVDFSDHWAQAIGQALHYGAMLERRPGVILVCHSRYSAEVCNRHRSRFDETMSYWTIGIMLWFCPTGAASLSDCAAKDYFGPN